MLYRFKSKASGDVIMTQVDGDEVLRAMGREPAERGIVTVAQLPLAIESLQSAVARQDAALGTRSPPADDAAGTDDAPAVGLKRRAWPMLDMLQRARDAEVDIVWGV